MQTIPQTRYARSGDTNIAYQTLGEGPIDLVYVPGWVSNVEMQWEEPAKARFLRGLASFARLILFDKRGTGLSDRVATLPTLEQRMDDVRAVLDAVGSERAALFGHSEGGVMSILFAATHPERTSALITYGAYAKRLRSVDYPWAPTLEDRMRDVEETERTWGDPAHVDLDYYAPSATGDTRVRDWLATYFRRSASPRAAADLLRMNTFADVTAILASVRVPTLILHARDDRDAKIEEARYLAARISGARIVELPSGDHFFWLSHADEILGEIQEFLTGTKSVPELDRVLATVLFTDIVDSTRHAIELGDHRWRDLIEAHHANVRAELRRYRGTEWDTAGDGFFATFDGPARGIGCAVAIRDAVRRLGIEVRAGLHTGECERIAGKLGGIGVVIAARVKERAAAGEILVTSTVRDLVSGSGLRFEDRGPHVLKGVPGEWNLYAAS
ncbi:MAG TPA: adenylate/guanylate cyclase domain-containing protein [Candidatus Dormibacteraeota bacterium]|nr:adenylate/guanylate cyclase domain-containing protein [Candidatus Dormibacteraeota bacterium]